jgi:carbonic anhydrase
MTQIVAVDSTNDIFPKYLGTPISRLLEYHNLGRPFGTYTSAELLIGMCMDHRKHLTIPDNFAYIIRAGGANLRYSDFKVSYAIAVGCVEAIALIAHTQCGMVNLMSKREAFVEGLVERAGWDRQRAEDHFMNYSPMFEIDNEVDFVIGEAERLSRHYPTLTVAPMLYKVEDNRIYLIDAETSVEHEASRSHRTNVA